MKSFKTALYGTVFTGILFTASVGWCQWPTFDIAKVTNAIMQVTTTTKSLTELGNSTAALTNMQQAIGDNVGSLSKFKDKAEEAQKEAEEATRKAKHQARLEKLKEQFEMNQAAAEETKKATYSPVFEDDGEDYGPSSYNSQEPETPPDNGNGWDNSDNNDFDDDSDEDIDEDSDGLLDIPEDKNDEFSDDNWEKEDEEPTPEGETPEGNGGTPPPPSSSSGSSRKAFGTPPPPPPSPEESSVTSFSTISYEYEVSSAFAAETSRLKYVSGSTEEGNFIWSDILATRCQLEIEDIKPSSVKKCVKTWIKGLNLEKQSERNEWIKDHTQAMFDHNASDFADTLADKEYAATFEAQIGKDLEQKAEALTNEREEVSFSGKITQINQTVLLKLMKAQASQLITESVGLLKKYDESYLEDDE